MSPELLKNKNRFQYVLSIMGSSEWLLFISTFIRRNNLVTKIYWFYLVLGLIGVTYIFFSHELASIEARFWIVGLTGGLLISLLISPVIHELIHLVAFKFPGSKRIKFRWSWKLFRFKVQAKNFVLSKRKYFSISILTFFLFSILPFILAFFSDGVLLFTLLSLSFFHALFALKDLAVCSYLYKFSDCYIYNSEGNETIFYKSLA